MLSDRQTWPELRFTWHLLPWHWRIKPRGHVDDIERWRYMSIEWMGIELLFMANKPMFRETADEIQVEPGRSYPWADPQADIVKDLKDFQERSWMRTGFKEQSQRPAGFTEPGPDADGGTSYGGAG